MKITSWSQSFSNTLFKYRNYLLVFFIFILSFSLRAYDMGNKYPFGWDQVDNAWVAKNMIVNHEFPLIGMVAKQNTGFSIGPAYYYFITIFYWLTNLNPVASQYIALTTSIFSFFVILIVAKKLFDLKVALMASVINAMSFAGFSFDFVQWPVALLPGISLLIFYFLYKLLKGEEKYVLFLAFLSGLAFNIHFTAIFFPIIIFLCLPFFPRNKKMILYSILSIPLFLIWVVPNLIYQFQNSSQLGNLYYYLSANFHGLHLRRFFQLAGDGLIQFDQYLYFQVIKPFKLLIIPTFIFIFLRSNFSKEKVIFAYLTITFFLAPWIIFSTYRGEISDYYFSINRFIALLITSYLLSIIFYVKKLAIKIFIIIIFAYYLLFNLINIFNYNDGGGLSKRSEKVASYIRANKIVGFQQGIPESYIYYYMMKEGGSMYIK